MKLPAVVALSSALVAAGTLVVPASAGENVGPEPELVLQYDFYGVEGALAPDGSGRDHAGTISSGTIVSGRRKPAVQLTGTGLVTTAALGVDLAGGALTVGAMCRPAAADGVLLAMGDANDGFSLYLKAGVPHFAVRSAGTLKVARGDEPLELDQWVHLAGVIGADGDLSLLVNAWTVGTAAATGPLARTPTGPFAVGADLAGIAGDGAAAPRWNGLVEDVRVYRGALSRQTHRDLLGDWANRPGCGCRK